MEKECTSTSGLSSGIGRVVEVSSLYLDYQIKGKHVHKVSCKKAQYITKNKEEEKFRDNIILSRRWKIGLEEMSSSCCLGSYWKEKHPQIASMWEA